MKTEMTWPTNEADCANPGQMHLTASHRKWNPNSLSPDTQRRFPYVFVILVNCPKRWKEAPERSKERFFLLSQPPSCLGSKVAIIILEMVIFNIIGSIH